MHVGRWVIPRPDPRARTFHTDAVPDSEPTARRPCAAHSMHSTAPSETSGEVSVRPSACFHTVTLPLFQPTARMGDVGCHAMHRAPPPRTFCSALVASSCPRSS